MASSGQAAGETLIALAKEHGVSLTPDNIREGVETMRNRALSLGDDALAKLSGTGLPDGG